MHHVSENLAQATERIPALTTIPVRSIVSDPPVRRPRTLHELVDAFRADEALDNPDTTVPLADLRLAENGLLAVPDVGEVAFTDWSRKQCASLLGLRWDKWFEDASRSQQADEINRRFSRSNGIVRVRTRRATDNSNDPDLLRAFVSPGYTAVPDSEISEVLAEVLAPADSALRLIRSDVTDKTASYVVAVGKPYRVGGDGEVGDVWGGLLVRNSGVGFASLFVSLHLTRLLCKNGMTAPLPDAILLKRRHRGLDGAKFRELIAERVGNLPGKLREGADVLRAGIDQVIPDVETALRGVLERANLPLRFLAELRDAYAHEPSATNFGIAQAITLAAQGFSPEIRVVLERAAGALLTRSN